MASQWDRVEAVKFLLDRAADVGIKNLKGNTALHEAAIGRFIPGYVPPEKLRSEFDGMMKVLLEAGGDGAVNVKNTAGRMARETFEDLWIKKEHIPYVTEKIRILVVDLGAEVDRKARFIL
ncbi:uncharacterized protein TrAFT101_008004 [Trichoderma asperellum]|nr:hypothetical protein TrAFT101_008004 [Trichoderma asperellum]